MKTAIRSGCAGMLLVALLPGNARALEHSADWLFELSFDRFAAAKSWIERGQGKLDHGAADGASRHAGTLRGSVDYQGWFSDTFGMRLVLDGHAGSRSQAGITEGWLTWQPVPKSPWRHRWRAGGFIPPFSLEHTLTGWTSPWMPTASVLNSWVGEELHVTGLEYSAQRSGAMAGSADTWGMRAGLFFGNDTSGTLLSWRGWAGNNRVTPRGRDLPLPLRAAFRPEGTFPGTRDTDPFLDIDGRPGYYVTGEWRRDPHIRLMAGHYDNRADPRAFARGQAGWRTRFNMLGVHWRPLADVEVLAQHAGGNTFVGRRGTQFSVDNDFSAWYVLLRRTLGRHELAARYEGFRVTDEDPNRLDDNRENGHVWAASWQFRPDRRWTWGVEYRHIDSRRPERALIGLPAGESESQFRLIMRMTL